MFKLNSVGIDIGTTTTHLIFSRLTLQNKLPGSQVPCFEITQKEIVYRSKIHFTPLIEHKLIAADKLKGIILEEYRTAGMTPDKVDTGAIIITGETAKKTNADAILHALSALAGNFVVATAGPDLESIIAGKGSGAAEIAKVENITVANVDIGGGTTNIAVFQKNRLVHSSCLNVGGRIIQIDPATQTITYIAEPAQIIIDYYRLPLKTGKKADMNGIRRFVGYMCTMIEEAVTAQNLSPLTQKLMLSGTANTFPVDLVMYSGGVASAFYQPEVNTVYKFGDLGILLGTTLRESINSSSLPVRPPRETIRATVIGAGMHTVKISGSTIYYTPQVLPLRNLPVVRLPEDIFQEKTSAEQIKDALAPYQDSLAETVALYVPVSDEISFRRISHLARCLTKVWQHEFSKPLVVITEKDIAQVLGQTLFCLMGEKRAIVCLDSISINDGDYIDIGLPVGDGSVLPVAVKTLAFNS